MTARPPRVLFAPAAGPQIGGGHVMRNLALAQALAERGVETLFAVPPWGGRLLERFARPPPPMVPLERSGEVAAIAAAAAGVGPDVLVLDDFDLEAPATAALQRPGRAVVVIDDLADRAYACDLLVDPSFGRRASDYVGRAPAAARVLVGPRHALLRRAFRRPNGEPLRPIGPGLERVFVSFGLSDLDAIAARGTAWIRALAPQAWIEVALASDAPSLAELRARAAGDPRLRLHPDARAVAELIRGADAGVGAGGSATWERFALGLPTLAVVVAENQRAMIGRLAQAGALLACDAEAPSFEADFGAAFARLADPGERARLRAAGLELCDGQGAVRVAEAILQLAG